MTTATNSSNLNNSRKPVIMAEQIIWLTGASSGIGEALVHSLQAQCRHLFITARNADALQALAVQYSNVSVLVADITDAEQMQTAATEITAEFGRLDTLIANAGTCEYLDVTEFDIELIRRVHETNFFGMVNTLNAALPLLRNSQRGFIAGMSSSVTWLAMPRAQAYGSSKAAVRHFLQCMQADLKQEGIDVSIISPGFVGTPLTDLNDFPMPGKISASKAADIITRGLIKRKAEIRFPYLFTLFLRFLGALPNGLRLRVTSAMAKNPNENLSKNSSNNSSKNGDHPL